eukprot:TRINITY_DN40592_c0_g1_i1.p1 TRINITY_DN40592_c0_g1~~TRINITY_DN40592_c0_g1_i1.p1  ORF type:complete len:295 (-),score=-16.09 TRINITY_DN40592_c0_g1_i1:214-1098(-)
MEEYFVACDYEDEEDYIDMEVAAESAAILWSAVAMNQLKLKAYRRDSRDFEFDKSAIADDSNDSPADELFYKGQLLPLHMLHNLRASAPAGNSTAVYHLSYESTYATPYVSRDVSGELVPDGGGAKSAGDAGPGHDTSLSKEPSWKRRLKKASNVSKALLRSFFYAAAKGRTSAATQRGKNKEKGSYASKYVNVMRRTGCCAANVAIQRDGYHVAAAVARSLQKDHTNLDCVGHRNSFSGSFPTTHVPPAGEESALKRSCSGNVDVESAIAHCKQSLFSQSRISASDQRGLCRG